ncbi:MAG: hypothetical protein QFF03_06130 [Pseudomonadota bacterium]|nr:hypothetical protein [Pseudomonadota bacterium]
MVGVHVGHDLAILAFEVLVLAIATICAHLFIRFFPKEREDDETYVIVDRHGRKITIKLAADGSPEQRCEQVEQLMKSLT